MKSIEKKMNKKLCSFLCYAAICNRCFCYCCCRCGGYYYCWCFCWCCYCCYSYRCLHFLQQRACILLFCCDSYVFAMLCRFFCCWLVGRLIGRSLGRSVWLTLFLLLVVLLELNIHTYCIFTNTYIVSHVYMYVRWYFYSTRLHVVHGYMLNITHWALPVALLEL